MPTHTRCFLFICLFVAVIVSVVSAQNHVLSLDGDGDYLEIVNNEGLNAINSQVTVEAWIKVTAFPSSYVPIIYKGDKRTSDAWENRSYTLWLNSSGFLHFASAPSGQGQMGINSSNDLIAQNQWYHVAGVVDAKQRRMALYLNGIEVARRDFGNDIHTSMLPLRIGSSHEEDFHGTFAGEIDEVRIWNIARAKEELQSTMHTTLSGKEPGLVGYWQFEGDGEKVIDATRNGHDGQFTGDAHRVEAELPRPEELVIPTVLSGMVVDESGQPVTATLVRLKQNGEEIAQVRTDISGHYWLAISQVTNGIYDFYATSAEKGAQKLSVPISNGASRELNLTLKYAVSIEGMLLMLDDKTPHVVVPVQALREGKVAATKLTDKTGKYRFVNLKPGRYQVRCQILGGYVYYEKGGNGKKWLYEEMTAVASDAFGDLVPVENDKTLRNIDFRFAPFKKGVWRHYQPVDGLVHNAVNCLNVTPGKEMWFGTDAGGASRYDGKDFVNFTMRDGMSLNTWSIYRAPDDTMWFGTWNRGVFKYDGKEFVNFTTADGLVGGTVGIRHCDSDGVLWFGSSSGSVSRYDGNEFVNFGPKDGLPGGRVSPLYRDSNGILWLATSGGVFSYDGKEFVPKYTIEDGLPSNSVGRICFAPDGVMWLLNGWGSSGGFSWYDGKRFHNLTEEDGLLHSNDIWDLHVGPDGVVWGCIWGDPRSPGGVFRYDGVGFVNFVEADGLLNKSVKDIHVDADGVLWAVMGSVGEDQERGGVSRYDEKTFISFTTKDGLPSNNVKSVYIAPDGLLWVGTLDGLARYDGKEFVTFTTEDGLTHNMVSVIHRDPNGIMWFGTGRGPWANGNGVSRYDGNQFTNFTQKEGLGHNTVNDIYTDPDGVVWFATRGGLTRYDGGEFISFTQEDGLASSIAYSIRRDPDGMMWLGTSQGISCYDGSKYYSPDVGDGVVEALRKIDSLSFAGLLNCPISIEPDSMALWFGLYGFGVFRYHDNEIVNFTDKDGLGDNIINDIYRDRDGVLWFGTDSRGVSAYDGVAWTSLDTRDGLADDRVTSVHQAPDGALWFGTDGGVTRYSRTTSVPTARITSVTTDQTYYVSSISPPNRFEDKRDLSAIPDFTIGTRVTIEYGSIDFKTIPEKRQYRVRIREIEPDWRPATKSTLFDHTFDESGNYTFQVQAIDRDLNYSEPASLTLKVVPPWYLNGWIAIPSGGGLLALLIWSIVSAVRYSAHRRESQRLREQMLEQERQSRQEIQALNEQLQDDNLRMAAELEITERIQRMILPSADELRAIAELDIAGYMEPADDVGGDYYDVLQREGTVAISIGDVTGHGLESGLVMLMTQTAVQALLQSGETDPVHLLDTLNRTIYNNVQRIKTDKNLTLCLLDYQSGELKLSGQHEEMIVVRKDGTVELVDTIDLGFPIGLDDDIADFIDQTTVQLQPGDGVVLYTDGITEAENTDGEQYGLERLCEVVSQHWVQSAEAIKEAVIADVRQHIGEQEVYDDITLVVMKQK